MKTHLQRLLSFLTVAAACGLAVGYVLGFRAVAEQGYFALAAHLALSLLGKNVLLSMLVAWLAASVLLLVWLPLRRVHRDIRRFTTAYISALTAFFGLLALAWRLLPRELADSGALPFFADTAAAFAVFLQRGILLKMSGGPTSGPLMYLILAGWLGISILLGLLAGILVSKGKPLTFQWPVAGRRTAIIGLVLFAAGFAPSLIAAALRPTLTDKPNILLISIDTLRVDRLGCYGGPAKTPHIDALAARGIAMPNALSPSPWTLPAHAAMFTGLHPSLSGIVDITDRLPEGRVTLAETLAATGYRTAGFVSHLFVSKPYGFAQGFAQYEYIPSEKADAVASRAIDWIDGKTKPWFVFCHFFDTHWPYQPQVDLLPPPGDTRLTFDLLQSADYARALRAAAQDPSLARKVWLPRYDAEIAEVDAALGRLFAALEKSGQAANTLIMLVSDHGEVFGEYPTLGDVASFGHGLTCQPEVIRVPWIIAGPGSEKVKVQGQVDLIDLPALMLQLAGLPAFSAFTVPSPIWFDGEAGSRPLVADTFLGGEARFGVYCGDRRYFSPVDVRYLDLHLQLLAVKTGEESNGSCIEDALAAHLAALQQAGVGRGSVSLNPNEIQRLRSLGYVGGGQ